LVLYEKTTIKTPIIKKRNSNPCLINDTTWGGPFVGRHTQDKLMVVIKAKKKYLKKPIDKSKIQMSNEAKRKCEDHKTINPLPLLRLRKNYMSNTNIYAKISTRMALH